MLKEDGSGNIKAAGFHTLNYSGAAYPVFKADLFLAVPIEDYKKKKKKDQVNSCLTSVHNGKLFWQSFYD